MLRRDCSVVDRIRSDVSASTKEPVMTSKKKGDGNSRQRIVKAAKNKAGVEDSRKNDTRLPQLMPEKPQTPWQKFSTFIDRPLVVGLVFLVLGPLGMLIPSMLILLEGIICFEFYREKVISGKAPWKQMGVYIALIVVTGIPLWVVHQWVIAHVIPRAYIYVEDRWMKNDHGFLVANLNGRTGGEDVSLGLVWVAVVSDTWGQPSSIQDLLKRADWQRGGSWVGGEEFNHAVVKPGHKFSVRAQYTPASPEEFVEIFSKPPKKYLVVLTVACYSDRWGPRPSDRTCESFSSDDDFQRPHDCIDSGNPKQPWWSFLRPECQLQ